MTDVFGDDWYSKALQARYARQQLERYVAVLAPIDPERYVGQSRRGSILFQFADHDRYISPHAARGYLEAAGPGHEVRWYSTSHEFNDPRCLADRQAWLAGKLKLRSR